MVSEKLYIIRVYFNDDFVGYVKDYRIYRNKKYRFNKTRNINKAYKFNFSVCENACNKLNNLRDDIYTKAYNFKCGEILHHTKI